MKRTECPPACRVWMLSALCSLAGPEHSKGADRCESGESGAQTPGKGLPGGESHVIPNHHFTVCWTTGGHKHCMLL